MSDAARGFTFVEVLCAIAILGIVTVGAAHAVGQARDHGERTALDAAADHLLHDGLALARSLPRSDEHAPGGFGLEPGETDPDDVDDLAGRSEQPPADLAGFAAGPRWRRTFVVEPVSVADPGAVVPFAGSHLLRIRVAVACDGAELTAGTILLARTP